MSPSPPSSPLLLRFPDPTHSSFPSSFPPPRPISPLASDKFSSLSSSSPITMSLSPHSLPPPSPSPSSSSPLSPTSSPKTNNHQDQDLQSSSANSLNNPPQADPDADWTLLSQYSPPFPIGDIASLHELPLSESNLQPDISHSQSPLSPPPPPDQPSTPPQQPASSTQALPSSEPLPDDPAMVQCQQWLSNLPLANLLSQSSINVDQDASDPDHLLSMSASRNYAPSQILSELGPDDSLSVVCGRPFIDRHRTITQHIFSNPHPPQTAPVEISQLTITPNPAPNAPLPPPIYSHPTQPTATQPVLVSGQVFPTLAETPLDYWLDPLMDLSSSYLHSPILSKPPITNTEPQLPSSSSPTTQNDPPTQVADCQFTQELLESAVDPFGPSTDPPAPSNHAIQSPVDTPEPRDVRRSRACLRLVFTAGLAALVALLSLWLQWRAHTDQLHSAQGVPSLTCPSFGHLEHSSPFTNISPASSSSEALFAPGPNGSSSHHTQDVSAPDAPLPTLPTPQKSSNMEPVPEVEPRPSLYSQHTPIEAHFLSPDPEPISIPDPIPEPSSASPPPAAKYPSPLASQPIEHSPATSEHDNHQYDNEQAPGLNFSIPWGFILVGLACVCVPRLVAVNTKQGQEKSQDEPSVEYIIAQLDSASADNAHATGQTLEEALRATACSPRQLKRLIDVLERRMRAYVYTRIELGLLAWATGALGDEEGAVARWRRFWGDEAKADTTRPVLSELVDELARRWVAGRSGEESKLKPGDCALTNGRPLKGRPKSPAVAKATRLKKSSSPAPPPEGEDESGSDSTVHPGRRTRMRATSAAKPTGRGTRGRHSEPAKLVVVKLEEDEEEGPVFGSSKKTIEATGVVVKRKGRASEVKPSNVGPATRSSPRIKMATSRNATAVTGSSSSSSSSSNNNSNKKR